MKPVKGMIHSGIQMENPLTALPCGIFIMSWSLELLTPPYTHLWNVDGRITHIKEI